MDWSFRLFPWGSPSAAGQVQWSKLPLSIVADYFQNISEACDLGKLPSADSFDQILRYATPRMIRRVFKVPQLSKLQQSQHHINKYQLVEAFLCFLLQLLYHKTDSMIVLYKDGFYNLEKELRFLLTILGHASLVLRDDEHASKQVLKLLKEFEAVANEAGSLVYTLLFSTDQVSVKMDKRLGEVQQHIDLLNDRIMEFLNPVSSNSRQACETPKVSVLDSLLFVDSLFYFLEDLIERMDDRVIKLMDLIKILYEVLKVSKSSIEEIGSPQPSEIDEFKGLLMQIGDMAHEAEYLVISFLVGDAPFWFVINRLAKVNYKIEVIGTKLQEIKKRNERRDTKVSKCFSTLPLFQERKKLEVDDVVIGFEDRIKYILGQLVGGTECLQVVSIFGMAGLGKTTLAKKLYNHTYVHDWFDIRLWCAVSQTYKRLSLLTDIWIQLPSQSEKGNTKAMDEESLVVNIYKTLKGRKYFIVLDDTWDQKVWDELRTCFPDDRNGSRILFTTRNKDVAPSNSNNYALPSLSNGQCWELLEKKVFGTRACPPELHGIGKKIAANCGGLPLVVVVIAGILSTMEKEENTWEQVRGNLATHIFDDGHNSVMQILELSYKHLPERLKPCFLYFGAFQEANEILVGKLMRLWISEGFIHKEEGKSDEYVAEKYLMELIDKSLVMVAKRKSDGGVKACALHDLFRDLCLKKSEEENFLSFVKSDTLLIYERGHRIHVPRNHVVSAISCQHTRSLHGPIISFYARDMRLLRVLNCDSHSGSNLSGAEYLVNLRYLVIFNLPPYIDRLVNLEYLNLTSFSVVYLPPKIMTMRKLRYIQSPIGVKFDKNCDCSETSNLEYLYRVWVTELRDEEILRCLPKLRKLKCRYRPFSSHPDNAEGGFADLGFLTQLESLKLGPAIVGIREISFPPYIKKLTLFRCPKDIFSINSEMISAIGKLKNLEVLKLRSISFEDKTWETKEDEFENLKFLKLCDIGDLDEWNVESSQHFPRLQQLVLKDCKNLQEIPTEIGEITTLEVIEVQGRCPKLLVKSAKEIQKEQRESGNEALRIIISVQSWLPHAGGSSSSG